MAWGHIIIRLEDCSDWLRSWSSGTCVAGTPRGHCCEPAEFIFSVFRFSGSMRRVTQSVWFLCRAHAESRAARHKLKLPINHDTGPLFQRIRANVHIDESPQADVPIDFSADYDTTMKYLKGKLH